MKYPRKQVRNYLVYCQHLHRRVASDEITSTLFSRLGCIQYDPLNICGRNADLVLHSRVRNYRTSILDTLLYEKRELIDGWDKMMSLYPARDWNAFTRMRQFKEEQTRGALAWRKSLHALKKKDEILGHLRKHGVSRPAAIDAGNLNPGAWGQRRQSSAVLDYLFHRGSVGVARKVNTQKLYDLSERLLPDKILKAGDPFKHEKDYHRWFILRRIKSVGILWNRSSVLWQNIGDKLKNTNYRQSLIDEMCGENILYKVTIDGISGPFYLHTEDRQLLDTQAKEKPASNMRLIAPLDNLIWDRDMVEALFDFNYRWEVYTPAHKRQFGYYVLPLLYQNAFVGRIEPVVDRKKKRLTVKNFWKEKSVRWTKGMDNALAAEMKNFCSFLDCERNA